jgi:two-component system response regulator YesN
MIMRVVIIDDEEWTRDTIKRIGRWRDLGFKISGEASDGVSGLECIRQVKPHLIITDMKMPGLDGAQMLRKLGEQQIDSKVIVVSGYSDYVYTRQALNSQAVDYLLKPIDVDEFNRVITRCAHEIQAREREDKPVPPTPLLQGLESGWLKLYQQARDDVKNSLDALSTRGIEVACQRIGELYQRAESGIRLALIVKINQDLQSIIDEVLVAWSVEESNRFSPARISFAIGSQKSIDDLLHHHLEIARELIDLKMQANQRKQRLDIETIRTYIDAHFTESVTLEALADNYAVSKEYLSTLFKKDTGVTFTEYLVRLRMEKAKDLIVNYHIPLQRVPEMVGYVDIPHFYKSFKRYHGFTPGSLREHKAQEQGTDPNGIH